MNELNTDLFYETRNVSKTKKIRLERKHLKETGKVGITKIFCSLMDHKQYWQYTKNSQILILNKLRFMHKQIDKIENNTENNIVKLTILEMK